MAPRNLLRTSNLILFTPSSAENEVLRALHGCRSHRCHPLRHSLLEPDMVKILSVTCQGAEQRKKRLATRLKCHGSVTSRAFRWAKIPTRAPVAWGDPGNTTRWHARREATLHLSFYQKLLSKAPPHSPGAGGCPGSPHTLDSSSTSSQ